MPLPAECGEGPEYVKMDKPKKPGKTMVTARPVQRTAARKTATRLHTSASRTNRTTVRKRLLASKVSSRANRLQTSQTTETANSRMQISRMPKSSRMQTSRTPISNRTPTSSNQEITVSRMPKASRKVRQDKAESATIETTVTDRIIVRPVNSATTTSAAMHQRTYVLAATEEEEALHRRRLTRNQVLANQLQLSTLRRKKMS